MRFLVYATLFSLICLPSFADRVSSHIDDSSFSIHSTPVISLRREWVPTPSPTPASGPAPRGVGGGTFYSRSLGYIPLILGSMNRLDLKKIFKDNEGKSLGGEEPGDVGRNGRVRRQSNGNYFLDFKDSRAKSVPIEGGGELVPGYAPSKVSEYTIGKWYNFKPGTKFYTQAEEGGKHYGTEFREIRADGKPKYLVRYHPVSLDERNEILQTRMSANKLAREALRLSKEGPPGRTLDRDEVASQVSKYYKAADRVELAIDHGDNRPEIDSSVADLKKVQDRLKELVRLYARS